MHRSIASTLLDFVFGNRAAAAVFAQDQDRLAALYRTALGDVSDTSTQVRGRRLATARNVSKRACAEDV